MNQNTQQVFVYLNLEECISKLPIGTRSNNQLVTMFTTILNCTSEEIKVDNTYKMNGVSRSKPLISRSKMR